MGMLRRLEQLSCEERLRGLRLFTLERTRLWRDVKRAWKKDGERLLTRACSDRAKGRGLN